MSVAPLLVAFVLFLVRELTAEKPLVDKFGVRGAPMPMVLAIGCPNIVFPYLRETISDVVIRAGFPPLLLNPVNFEALYVQQQQQQAAQQPAGATH